MISKDAIQKLRGKTGVSVMLCKRALEKADGDMDKAISNLKEEGALMASKKSSRVTKSGIIASYIHAGRIGVLAELKCETDFVSKNPEFQSFARELAMQIASSNPEDVAGLLNEPYIRDPGKTVKDYLNEAIRKFGENIEISRFSRMEL